MRRNLVLHLLIDQMLHLKPLLPIYFRSAHMTEKYCKDRVVEVFYCWFHRQVEI